MTRKTKQQKAVKKTKPPKTQRKHSGGARPGNKHATIYDTPEKRADLMDAICKHLENGLSHDCFPYCDWKTVKKYANDYPDDFPEDRLNEAVRRGQMVWETLGMRGAMGRVGNFSAASWIFNMKNRYGWKDKKEIDHKGAVPTTAKPHEDMTPEEAAQRYNEMIKE